MALLAAVSAAGAAIFGSAHASGLPESPAPASAGSAGCAGEARFDPRGRFQYDMTESDFSLDDGSIDEGGSSSYARRSFLGAQGCLSQHWRYKVDLILPPGSDHIGVDDAYLEYRTDDWSIIIGESKIASPLEDRTSSLDIPFVERSSMINAFGYGRRGGLAFIRRGGNWHWSAAAQAGSLNTADGNFPADESTALSTRFTFAPILVESDENARLVHLGVHARVREAEDTTPSQVRARPLNGRGSRSINASSAGVNRFTTDVTYGGELALQLGPFGAQAEYSIMNGDTLGGASHRYDAGYVDIYWSLTGESRVYEVGEGAFDGIEPSRPVDAGGPGHVMLSARYEAVDLSDSPDTQAGSQTAYSIGLDWVPVERIRFKLNYAHSDIDRDDLGEDGEADIISLRTQLSF